MQALHRSSASFCHLHNGQQQQQHVCSSSSSSSSSTSPLIASRQPRAHQADRRQTLQTAPRCVRVYASGKLDDLSLFGSSSSSLEKPAAGKPQQGKPAKAANVDEVPLASEVCYVYSVSASVVVCVSVYVPA
jgi:hypothetical protein